MFVSMRNVFGGTQIKYIFHTCDVFTDVRFGGNPLAVVLGAEGLCGDQMQCVAREFNLSETVFVLPPETAANTARVRIFTPQREMQFAGHPTVGCACLLVLLLHGQEEDFEIEIRLEELAGLVPVRVRVAKGQFSAQFVAPGVPEIIARNLDHSLISRGLSLTMDDIGFDSHACQAVSSAGNAPRLFVPVKSLAALSGIKISYPAFGEAKALVGAKSIVAYTRSGVDRNTDFSVRMFAPSGGILEDPATGSAVAMFPEQIAEFEDLAEGDHCWRIEQGYDMGRPSQLLLEADRLKATFKEIRVAGSTVFVASGEIEI